MKKKELYLIIGVIVIFNVFTLKKLKKVEGNLNDNIIKSYQREENLRNEINDIYSNVNKLMKKEASIIDSYEVSFGSELNPDNLTVPVKVTMTPKINSEDLTAKVEVNGELLNMIKNETYFLAETEVSIFENIEFKFLLSEKGVQKAESLDESYDLKGKYLLEIMNAGFQGSLSQSKNKYSYDGDIVIDFNRFEEDNPKSLTIFKTLNEKIIEDEEIDLDKINLSYGNPITISFKDSFDFKSGDVFEVYAEVVDKYDLTYKYRIISYEIDSEGNTISRVSDDSELKGIIEIKNKEGKILYN